MYFSKSKYCEFKKCTKKAWLSKYKPEEKKEDATALAIMATGNEVGDLAMGMFGPFVEVTVLKEDGRPDIAKMEERTKEEIAKGTEIICEASFDYNGLYCAVDILKKTKNGYAIYEVKSTKSHNKPEYVWDLAYQKYVLTQCGINVDGTFLVHFNPDYTRGEELELDKLFIASDMSEKIEDVNVEEDLKEAEKVLKNESEPVVKFGGSCRKNNHSCPYWEYCSKDLPTPSIFDLTSLSMPIKAKLFYSGIKTLDQALNTKYADNKLRKLQMLCAKDPDFVHVDKDGIREFLNSLSYPLYFLDFETMMPGVPLYKGNECFKQIPFQYSLHYIESEGGKIEHKEFLAESGKDPCEDIAKRLCEDIPQNACVLAYNADFERGKINQLASTFPEYKSALIKIAENIVDLETPFKHGHYYVNAMHGSTSIKHVLPALFPSDPEFNYNSLEGVHNGGEAMSIYPQIAYMNEEDAQKTRAELLAYCKLDTLAMVKIWQKLVEICN